MKNFIVLGAIIGVAVVVLGLVSLSQNNLTSQIQQSQPTTQPLQEQGGSRFSLVVNLSPQNNSGESGTATLIPLEGGRTRVILDLKGAPRNVIQPAHIHAGSCADLGRVLYSLTSVVNGKSETVLNFMIDEGIFNKMPLAINVHKSVNEENINYACGDIKTTSGSLENPTLTPSSTSAPIPTTSAPTVRPQTSPVITGDDNQSGGGVFQTPDDRRRGADKPED